MVVWVVEQGSVGFLEVSVCLAQHPSQEVGLAPSVLRWVWVGLGLREVGHSEAQDLEPWVVRCQRGSPSKVLGLLARLCKVRQALVRVA